jgi:hypothetical protein
VPLTACGVRAVREECWRQAAFRIRACSPG